MNLKARIASLERTLLARSRLNSVEFLRYRRQVLWEMHQSVGGTMSALPTPRWRPLRFHKEQHRLWTDGRRFRGVPAGRRSGKTEIAKRFIVLWACSRPMGSNERFIAAAPVEHQAVEIYWNDLCDLVPKPFLDGEPSIGGHSIYLVNGCRIQVAGLDKPSRVEGPPLHGIVLDEYADMKREVWDLHVRLMLADTNGWAWAIGVPEGRNHYYDLCEAWRGRDDSDVYSWWSHDILPESEIELLAETLDPIAFDQETKASFSNFAGRVYYCFSQANAELALPYDPKDELIFCFDFNVSPGVAVVCQERDGKTFAIDEVHIPVDSNTPLVCETLTKRYKEHEGPVLCYGDATGGAKGTAKVSGSDVDLIRNHMRAVYKDRFSNRFRASNPAEKARVNAVNARLLSKSGERRLVVSRSRCKNLIKDFDGVRWKEGADDVIDKKYDPRLTHLTDALGYYVHARFPVRIETSSPTSQEA